jgi:hypothetical protein
MGELEHVAARSAPVRGGVRGAGAGASEGRRARGPWTLGGGVGGRGSSSAGGGGVGGRAAAGVRGHWAGVGGRAAAGVRGHWAGASEGGGRPRPGPRGPPRVQDRPSVELKDKYRRFPQTKWVSGTTCHASVTGCHKAATALAAISPPSTYAAASAFGSAARLRRLPSASLGPPPASAPLQPRPPSSLGPPPALAPAASPRSRRQASAPRQPSLPPIDRRGPPTAGLRPRAPTPPDRR